MALNPQQLADLWQRAAPSLLLLARTRCDLAEDCVQEAFVKLSLQQPVPDDPVAWLVRVVRNAAIDMARSEKRRKQREQANASERPSWFEGQDAFERVLVERDVQQALMQLTPDQREIVVAHVWGGLSFRQIGMAFDISSSAAHRSYSESLLELKRALTNHAPNSF